MGRVDTHAYPASDSGAGLSVRFPPGWPWLVAAAAIALLVLMPVVSLGVLAFKGSGGLWPHLAAYVLPRAARDTFILLGGVAIVTSVIGVGTAWLTSTCRFPLRRVFDWALLLPMAMPAYIVAYTYLDVLHPLGPVQSVLRALLGISSPAGLWFPSLRSMGGCVLLMGCVLYPYVYLSARAMFLMQSACMLDVARTLGAGPWRTFWRVAVPLAYPAIAVGVSLALMETLNDLGAVEFLGVRTLTVSVYSTWVNRSSLEGAAQIALFMLAIVACLIALERWARRHQRYMVSARRNRRTTRVRLHGARAGLAFMACALPVIIGCLVPALYLAHKSWRVIHYKGMPQHVWGEALNSVAFASGGALLTVLCGLVLAYAVRTAKTPAARVLSRMASLGYAVPGTVLAVGLLMPLAAFDNEVDHLARQWLGFSTGLLLTGTGFSLIFAYSIRFMAVAVGNLEAGYAKISPTIDEAARNLGETALGAAWRIHIPLLRPALFSAALLVFVDGMKELSATLLLRPFDFETLATHVYMEASRGTYEDGALAALLIAAVGLVPVALLARAARPAVLRVPRK